MINRSDEALSPELAKLLTDEQFRQSRSPAKLSQWIEDVKNQARKHKSDIDAANKRRGSFKEFYEEACVVHHCVQRLPLDERYRIHFPVDNNETDAWISNVNSTCCIPVQITVAESYKKALRREHLVEHRFVPGEGDIWRNRITEQVEINWRPESSEDYVETIREVCAVIDKKIEKKYPSGTWLFVGFDSKHVELQGCFAKLRGSPEGLDIIGEIEKHVQQKENSINFARIYLVGYGGAVMERLK